MKNIAPLPPIAGGVKARSDQTSSPLFDPSPWLHLVAN